MVPGGGEEGGGGGRGGEGETVGVHPLLGGGAESKFGAWIKDQDLLLIHLTTLTHGL